MVLLLHKANFLVIVLVASTLMLAAITAETINAMVPQIVSVQPYNLGPNSWLNITINYFPITPSTDTTTGVPGNWVDILEVTADGDANEVSIGPVITEYDSKEQTFTWQYNLGQISGSTTVTVRGHSSINGWGPTSSPVTVQGSNIPAPEFPLLVILLPLILIVSLSLIIIKRTSQTR